MWSCFIRRTISTVERFTITCSEKWNQFQNRDVAEWLMRCSHKAVYGGSIPPVTTLGMCIWLYVNEQFNFLEWEKERPELAHQLKKFTYN